MNDIDFKLIYDYYNRTLASVTVSFHRYLYDKINWNARLIGIMGARGVGKTTMLIQRIKECFPNPDRALYASLDQMWFNMHTLYELAEHAASYGVTHLFLDEVHRYKNWQQEIKMIYDTFPELTVVYTGSSMLEIERSKADLSRRQTVYHLQGLSLREYLSMENIADFEPITLTDLFSNHNAVAQEVTSKIKILPIFEKYLRTGYYPFFNDAGEDYLIRLAQTTQIVLDIDLPGVIDLSFASIQKTKKLLMYIASSIPFVPDLTMLFKSVEISRDAGLRLLNALNDADLLMLFSTKQRNYKNLIIPEKIFLQNSNLIYSLADSANIGSIRETFFLNQLSQSHEVVMPAQGDFLIDGKYTIEVGGKGKTYKQIADIENSYLAVDNTEVGYRNRIPLWMFGFLY